MQTVDRHHRHNELVKIQVRILQNLLLENPKGLAPVSDTYTHVLKYEIFSFWNACNLDFNVDFGGTDLILVLLRGSFEEGNHSKKYDIDVHLVMSDYQASAKIEYVGGYRTQ